MGADYYWKGPSSSGQQIAKSFGLKSPEPVFGNTAWSGSTLFIFKSEGKFYLWNMAEDTVWEIVHPTDQEEIRRLLWADDLESLKMQEV